jgi:neutral ceramidase
MRFNPSAGPLFFLTILLLCLVGLTACAGESDGASSDDDVLPAGDDDDDDDNDDNDDDDDDDNDDNDDDDDNDTVTQCVLPGGLPVAPLRAGVASGDLYAPIGLSLGGFGTREGPKHPLAVMLGGATGRYDRLQVKAVTLDNGADRLVIVRLPTCFPVDVLYWAVIDAVCVKSGVDLTEKLWLNSNHSHSGPARHFPVPAVFAIAGTGTWYQPFVDAFVDSIAETIMASMDNLEPASLAVGLDENFDPDDQVARDRQCQDDPPRSKENRLMVTRIDRADGSPLTVLLGYGTHGTMFNEPMFTSDVMGWAEFAVQDRFDTPVEVLALNTSGGDQAPNYDAGQGHGKLAKMEIIGGTVADRAMAVYQGLTPTRDVTFEMVATRLAMSREAIGYQPGEFGAWSLGGEWRDYEKGAYLCGEIDMSRHGSIQDCDNPETKLIDGYLGCIIPLDLMPFWTMPFETTTIAAVRLQDEVLMLFPGELSSGVAMYAIDQAAQTHGLDPAHVHSFGYSNDHQWYLFTEESWFQGGSVVGNTMWGPKFATWLADELVILAGQLFTPEDEENLATAPETWPYTDPEPSVVEPEESDRDPQMLLEPASAYERLSVVEVQWSGGFTSVDDPHITLQRLDGEEFVPVILPSGRAFTDQDYHTILTYSPEPDYNERKHPAARLHRFALRWEITVDFPAGTYRFAIAGATWDGSQAVAYEIASVVFEVLPTATLTASDLQIVALGDDAFELSLVADYPPVEGGYRLRDAAVAPADPWPTRSGAATVTISEPEAAEVVLTWDEGTERFVGEFQSAGAISLTAQLNAEALVDDWGNTNAAALGPVAFPE